MNVTQLQSLGVKFYCHVCEDGSKPVTTGSIGGYLAELTEYTKSEIIGAIVKLEDESDFPDSFDLTTSDVLGKTQIHISDLPGDFAGDLSVTLAGGWYALVFAATGIRDENAAIMPGVNGEIGDPLYFFGEPTGTANGFRYLDGGGLNAIRMFVDSDPAAPVPEPSTLLLLGSGLAGLGGVAWRQHRRNGPMDRAHISTSVGIARRSRCLCASTPLRYLDRPLPGDGRGRYRSHFECFTDSTSV